MDIAQIAATRHTAKAFDPARKIPDDLLAKIRALLRNSPSSVNSQPWHFVIAGSADAKARLARAMPAPYAYNAAKVRNASHAVVFCVRTVLDDAYLESILAAEIAAGRLPTPDAIANQRKSRLFYADLHRQVRQDVRPWMERQVYIALGNLLLGAAALGLDACPMEGFDADLLDAELGLPARNLAAVAIVALGTRGADDWNAALPKARLPAAELFTEL